LKDLKGKWHGWGVVWRRAKETKGSEETHRDLMLALIENKRSHERYMLQASCKKHFFVGI
jgi:hypothetical protein